jgi:uncharacterized protein (DUF1499 family)
MIVRHLGKAVLLVAVGIAAFVALTRWPLINDVETGRTPEYPDLRVREFVTAESTVAKAARKTVERLPRWTFVGEGRGPGGTEIQAVARTRVFSFKDDVTIRIRRAGGMTKLSVRSRSRFGKWDFGQNARNIKEFLKELDQELFVP